MDSSLSVLAFRRGAHCPTGKIRHPSEVDALSALLRVRKQRTDAGELRDHETRIYPCWTCQGWHLTSKVAVHPEDFTPEPPQNTGETWERYVRRLEKRIAEQRAQLLSLHAIGHGGSNKDARRRISALTIALGRMTERWENERRNRAALVERLRSLEAIAPTKRRWLRRVS